MVLCRMTFMSFRGAKRRGNPFSYGTSYVYGTARRNGLPRPLAGSRNDRDMRRWSENWKPAVSGTNAAYFCHCEEAGGRRGNPLFS